MKLVRLPNCESGVYVNADLVEFIYAKGDGTDIVTVGMTNEDDIIHVDLSVDKVAKLLSGSLVMIIGDETYK